MVILEGWVMGKNQATTIACQVE
uniref:Uncharacterized protein n=1 Tax=Arundo donax TaxID=35708 RepID=A0A0A8XQA1_ARUDO